MRPLLLLPEGLADGAAAGAGAGGGAGSGAFCRGFHLFPLPFFFIFFGKVVFVPLAGICSIRLQLPLTCCARPAVVLGHLLVRQPVWWWQAGG